MKSAFSEFEFEWFGHAEVASREFGSAHLTQRNCEMMNKRTVVVCPKMRIERDHLAF